jgi:hypothetical protein
MRPAGAPPIVTSKKTLGLPISPESEGGLLRLVIDLGDFFFSSRCGL